GNVESTFQASGKGTATNVDSTVDHFRSASGARWDLNRGLKQLRSQTPGAKTFGVSGIGQQAIGFKFSGKTGNVPFSLVYIVVLRGSYLAATGISVAGVVPAPPVSAVERYARVVDGRVKNA
ncbi:MAG TPA: hypothetical protein VE865_15555, partial [Bradyrhizobium sp.]|nr:hypothetical protein [Bradyrhizobium sp.]